MEKLKRNYILQKGLQLIASLSAAAVLCITWNIWRTLRFSGIMEVKDRILLALQIPILGWLLTAAVIWLLYSFLARYGEQTAEFLYRYRFLIAAAVWILCIIFKINGSSIAYWGEHLGIDLDSRGLLLGTSRGIRADEWATYTPMMLSQQYNSDGAFPYFSEVIRGTTTDTFIVYGLPVKDIAVLFRPFHWGFLFLGAERGFSFYWCGRVIALALVSFEFGMLITKGNRTYSWLLAVLFTLAPTVQWWIGVNGLLEMMIFGQLSVLMLHRYMHTEIIWKRLLCGLVLVVCAGGFVLVFYPAWQVPIAYIILGLLLWVLLDSWKTFSFRAKRDLPVLIGCLLLLGIGMAYVFLKSSDSVLVTLNTAYPGKRVNTGGGDFLEMLRYGGTFFFPLISANLTGNHSEMSVFVSFAPLGVLLSLFVIFKEKTRDRLLIIMIAAELFLNVYMIFGFPELLAKVTLLSKSSTGRVTQIIGIVDLILLFRALSLWKTEIKKRYIVLIAVIFSGLLSAWNCSVYGAYLSKALTLAMAVILFAGCALLLGSRTRAGRRLSAVFFTFLMFYCGGLVNPVQQGTDVVYDTDLMRAVREIVEEEPDGLWICDNLGYPMNDYFIMGGAPTIDSINVYPDTERWASIDPDGKYEEIYNRYAHITTVLHQGETTFRMGVNGLVDNFDLDLNVDDLRTLDVSYVASMRGLEELETENVGFELIEEVQGIYLYRVAEK